MGHRGICNHSFVIYALDIALTDVALANNKRQEKEIVLIEITKDLMDAIEVLE